MKLKPMVKTPYPVSSFVPMTAEERKTRKLTEMMVGRIIRYIMLTGTCPSTPHAPNVDTTTQS